MRIAIVCLLLIAAGVLAVGLAKLTPQSPSSVGTSAEDDPVVYALQEGRELSSADAVALRERLRDAPGDSAARLRLLGFIFHDGLRGNRDESERIDHVVWFIENDPSNEIIGSPLGGTFLVSTDGRIAAAWKHHLERPSVDPATLLSASRFFSVSSPDESKAFLEKGERLQPDSHIWASELATLTMRPVTVALSIRLGGRVPARPVLTEEECTREAGIALKHVERALRLCEPGCRFGLLAGAANASFVSGDFGKAGSYAEEILKAAELNTRNRHWRDYVHEAHAIRGRIALRNGEVAAAIGSLEEAGRVGSPDAPVLRSFGPDFFLANELLDRGENKAVLSYLGECERFWKPKRVARWRELLRRGERPRLSTGFDPDEPEN